MTPAASEQLRQARETFDLNKTQVARWFALRLAMGYAGLVLLFGVAATCAFVIVDHRAFPIGALTPAMSILCGDFVAILAATWRLVLSPAAAVTLSPTTWARTQGSAGHRRSRATRT